MRFSKLPLSLTALLMVSSLGTIASAAQDPQNDSDIPSFTKESPKVVPQPEESHNPALQPLVVPTLTMDGSTNVVAGEAQVIPPPPRIVTRAPGKIVIPGGSLGGANYASQSIATSSLKVNSNYGWRHGRRHTGIDFDGDLGQTVGASMAATVAFAGVKHGYGNVIILDHGNGIATYYAHLSAMYVEVGQAISPGQVIGAIGSTGRSTGPHLHYEVRINGNPINPTAAISVVDGEYFVDGNPLVKPTTEETGGDEAAPAPQKNVSRPATVSRPRRVSSSKQENGVQKTVVFVAEDSMSSSF